MIISGEIVPSTCSRRTPRQCNPALARPEAEAATLVSQALRLRSAPVGGAAVDVLHQEPLPPDHPFRSLPNLLATPHIGYVSRGLYERFYRDTVQNILHWLDRSAGGGS